MRQQRRPSNQNMQCAVMSFKVCDEPQCFVVDSIQYLVTIQHRHQSGSNRLDSNNQLLKIPFEREKIINSDS